MHGSLLCEKRNRADLRFRGESIAILNALRTEVRQIEKREQWERRNSACVYSILIPSLLSPLKKKAQFQEGIRKGRRKAKC